MIAVWQNYKFQLSTEIETCIKNFWHVHYPWYIYIYIFYLCNIYRANCGALCLVLYLVFWAFFLAAWHFFCQKQRMLSSQRLLLMLRIWEKSRQHLLFMPFIFTFVWEQSCFSFKLITVIYYICLFMCNAINLLLI